MMKTTRVLAAVLIAMVSIGCAGGGDDDDDDGSNPPPDNSVWEVIANNAAIYETEITSGDSWDVPGGLPDPFVCLGDASNLICTTSKTDTLSPNWNETLGTYTFLELGSIPLSVFDLDVSDAEIISTGDVDLRPSTAGEGEVIEFSSDNFSSLRLALTPN